jgi:hypothetical protein
MKKYIIKCISTIILLSFLCLQLPITSNYAAESNTKKADINFNWKADLTHVVYDYNSVVYGKGLYVAVGDNGIISVSKDLKSWNNIIIDNLSNFHDLQGGFETVLFNGEIFVAAGVRDIATSKDGYHWSKLNADTFNEAFGSDTLIFGGITKGKVFVLVGLGVLAYSYNGTDWKNISNYYCLNSSSVNYTGSEFWRVINDGEKLITVSKDYNDDGYGIKECSIHTSKDGVVWNKAKLGIPENGSVGMIFYNLGKYFISYYSYNEDKSYIYESSDLKQWIKSESLIDRELFSIGKKKYKLGDGIYSYQNDKGFIAEYKTTDSDSFTAICEGNGKAVAVGDNGLIVYSDDIQKGIWKRPDLQPFNSIYSAAANSDCVVAVGQVGQIIKSKDGQNWSKSKTNITSTIHSIIYDGKSFIAVGDNGLVATSKDGEAWTVLNSVTKNNLYTIKKLNNIYVAVGENSTILSSKDGKVWTLAYGEEKDKNILFVEPIRGVAFRDNTYYAIGYNSSTVYTSKDAINWKESSRLSHSGYSDLIFYKGRFVLTGTNEAISKEALSSDMKTETIFIKEIIGYYSPLYKISVMKNYLLKGFYDGSVFYSPDGLSWNSAGNTGTQDKANCFVEFKGKIYSFTENGAIITGSLKGSIPDASDITAIRYNNKPSCVKNMTLLKQPIFRNNTILLSLDTIANLIDCQYSYDKSKKTAQLSIAKKNIKFTINSKSATANGKKITMGNKAELNGSSVYVPAEITFKALGYTFNYDSFKRKISTTTDDTIVNKSLTYKPVNIKNTSEYTSFKSISYNKKTFVAVAGNGDNTDVFTSVDGVNWDRTTTINDGHFSKVLWNGKRFIAAGGTSSTHKTLIYTSEDGFKWKRLENIPDVKYICDAVVGASGQTADESYSSNSLKKTILVSYQGDILSSDDGLVWKKSFTTEKDNWFYTCWYKGTFYVTGRDKGKVYSSTNGQKWTVYNTKMPISKLFSSGGKLWAVNEKNNFGNVYRTINGKDWEYIFRVHNADISRIVCINKSYIAIGHKKSAYSGNLGLAMVSKNSDMWENADIPPVELGEEDIFHFGNLTLVTKGPSIYMLKVK